MSELKCVVLASHAVQGAPERPPCVPKWRADCQFIGGSDGAEGYKYRCPARRLNQNLDSKSFLRPSLRAKYVSCYSTLHHCLWWPWKSAYFHIARCSGHDLPDMAWQLLPQINSPTLTQAWHTDIPNLSIHTDTRSRAQSHPLLNEK